jgi:hypothetical protein
MLSMVRISANRYDLIENLAKGTRARDMVETLEANLKCELELDGKETDVDDTLEIRAEAIAILARSYVIIVDVDAQRLLSIFGKMLGTELRKKVPRVSVAAHNSQDTVKRES